MQDEMRVIEEAPDYSVSRDGKVYSRITKKEIKPRTVNTKGSQMVSLKVDGKVINRYLHRLVADAYIPPPNDPKANQVTHLDTNKKNNKVENLIWISRSDLQEGLFSKTKLNPKKVREIRWLFSQGLSQQNIADKFKVSTETIRRIVNNIYWKHVR